MIIRNPLKWKQLDEREYEKKTDLKKSWFLWIARLKLIQ